MNKWINIDEKLPDTGQIVMIKLKYPDLIICVAKFSKILMTRFNNYENIFLTLCYPKFPHAMMYMSLEEYEEIFIIKKDNIEFWMSIPELPI